MYQDMLEDHLISSAKKVNLERKWTIQQEKDPKHTTEITQEGIEWSCQSPNLNLIENLCRILKFFEELKTVWQYEWSKIEPQCCKKSITSQSYTH